MPAADPVQAESTTPTALAMIALAVMDGQLPLDDSTRASLTRLSGARTCAAACPYGYDVASIIDEFVTKRTAPNAPASPS
jgi:Fe-S oxidoreductase